MIARKIEQKLIDGLKNFRVVMLNGPRQSGKTTLVKHIAKKLEMDYITLDEREKLNLAKVDPKNFLKFFTKNKKVVIDEIQFAPELIPYIKMIVDEENLKGKFLLTGSADFMKMHKITESLAGRMVRYTLYTLSNAELNRKNQNIIDALLSDDFINLRNYGDLEDVLKAIIRGGYPEVIELPQNVRNDWFASYIDSRIEKDILALKSISLSKLFYVKKLLQLLATYDAQLLNYDNIAKRIKLDNKTVLSYVTLLEAMYIVKRLSSYNVNTALRVIKSAKIHFLDTGLLSYLLGLDIENLFLHKDDKYGNIIETFVYLELLKEASYAKDNVQIYHFRDLKKKEVDLIVENRSGNVIAIEVKAKAIIKSNDLKGLVKFAKESQKRFLRGYIFYGGDEIIPIAQDGFLFFCIPLGVLA